MYALGSILFIHIEQKLLVCLFKYYFYIELDYCMKISKEDILDQWNNFDES